MIALEALEQDALTEIFNIGVGIAADALYQMVGEHVPLSVPVIELTSQHEAQSTIWTASHASCAPSAKPTRVNSTPMPF
jgi:chemotaxis protein CheY-P-specific phosphatase CheC